MRFLILAILGLTLASCRSDALSDAFLEASDSSYESISRQSGLARRPVTVTIDTRTLNGTIRFEPRRVSRFVFDLPRAGVRCYGISGVRGTEFVVNCDNGVRATGNFRLADGPNAGSVGSGTTTDGRAFRYVVGGAAG